MAAPRKLTDDMLARAKELLAEGKTKRQLPSLLSQEFGIQVARSTLQEALIREEEHRLRDASRAKVKDEEARLVAEATRTLAAQIAEDLPEDGKLVALKLATTVSRADAAWDAMRPREKACFKTWAKLEDLAVKLLVVKLRLGGALTDEDLDLDAARASLKAKLDKLTKAS